MFIVNKRKFSFNSKTFSPAIRRRGGIRQDANIFLNFSLIFLLKKKIFPNGLFNRKNSPIYGKMVLEVYVRISRGKKS
jgi:hypothetical protein